MAGIRGTARRARGLVNARLAELAGGHLAEIGARVAGHPGTAGLWRIEPSDGPRAYGMCGRLTTYPAARAARVG